MKRSLVVILTIAVLLFAFSGFALASEREDAAQRLLSFGVIEGFPGGDLGLERDITRAEFARIVVLARGLGDAAEVLQGTQTVFSDVQAGAWFTGWINVASAQGIILGYPDGTFRPNANISYAEAVTMILRTLGYNDNLPGVWPHNYLVQGADLSITGGLVTNATANAVRGNVFVMLNRAFDNYVVRWDPEQMRFVEDSTLEGHNFTLLQWMLRARESVRGIVIDNLHTDTSLRDNEIVLQVTTTTIINRETVVRYDEEIFVLTGQDLDANELLGLEVELFHNDNNVYFANIRTNERDLIIEKLDGEFSDNDRISLQGRDNDVRIAGNAEFVIFSEDGTVNRANADRNGELNVTIAEESFGRFVLERGEIRFAWIFESPQDFAGVVTAVNNNRVEYFVGEGNERTLNLNGFDEVFVLDGNLRSYDADQVDVDSVIYAWINEDNELFLVTVNNVHEGTLTSYNRSRVTVGGVNISVNRAVTTVSDSANDFVELYYVDGSISDVVENLDGETVLVARDLIGDARHIVGVAAGTSGLQYGIVVSTGGARAIDIFTQDDRIVSYNFARNATFRTALTGTLGTTAQSYFNHFIGNDPAFLFVEFRINRNGEISEIRLLGGSHLTDYPVNDLRAAGNGSIVLGTPNRTFFVTNRTVFMATEGNDEDNLEVVRWNDIRGMNPHDARAVIFTPQAGGSEAVFVVFTRDFGSLVGDDNLFGIVHGAAAHSGGIWRMPIQVVGEASQNIRVANQHAVPRNSIIEFRLNSDNEVRNATGLTLTAPAGGVVRAIYGDVHRVMNVNRGIATLRSLRTGNDFQISIESGAAIRSVGTDRSIGGTTGINSGNYIIFVGPDGDILLTGVDGASAISAALVLPRSVVDWLPTTR